MAEINIEKLAQDVAEKSIQVLRDNGVFIGRWIPISERFPEENGEYLITWTTSQSKRPFIVISEGEVTSEYDHEFEWLLEDYVKNYPDVKVIAWMPLPKPYKAESEVEECL